MHCSSGDLSTPTGAWAPSLDIGQMAKVSQLLLSLRIGCLQLPLLEELPQGNPCFMLLTSDWQGKLRKQVSAFHLKDVWNQETGNSANTGKVSKSIGKTKSVADVYPKLLV